MRSFYPSPLPQPHPLSPTVLCFTAIYSYLKLHGKETKSKTRIWDHAWEWHSKPPAQRGAYKNIVLILPLYNYSVADEYFKAHCHPQCLHSCVASCQPGCCPEHDKVSVTTGLAKHCHSSCLTNCVPACGSGCCSADEEMKRGHHFLHYQKIRDYQKAKDQAEEKTKTAAKQHDEPKKQEDNSKCHPQCKQTCLASCGKGCCSEEGERMRDEQERKEKDAREKERKENELARAHAQAEKDKAIKALYKHQPRLCPAPCPQVRYSVLTFYTLWVIRIKFLLVESKLYFNKVVNRIKNMIKKAEFASYFGNFSHYICRKCTCIRPTNENSNFDIIV